MANFPTSEFFNTGFEDTAIIAGVSITVHFLNEYEVASNQDVPFEGNNPMIYALSSSVSAVVQDTLIVINGITYKAGIIQPDGTGITLIELYR